MPLTDAEVRTAKAADKPYKMGDERGLFILVHPNGSKYWRMKYRVDGKEKLLALGVYPEVGLKEARERRDDARKMLDNGGDPSSVKKTQKATRIERAENTFKAVALEWYEKQKPLWSEGHASKTLAMLKNDTFKKLGDLPVAEITAPVILETLNSVQDRGALYTAGRVKESIGRVMRYAVATGRTHFDPVPALKGVLTAHVEKHMASVTDPKRLGEILRLWDTSTTGATVRNAMNLAPLVFVRIGELRRARWSDIDLDKAEWRYLISKTQTPHIVPLSKQAKAIIKAMEPISGHLEYVFPGRHDPKKPMSEAAINVALRRLGISTQDELTGHGFRAMARTMLDEVLGYPPHVIEHQLAHTVKDPLGRAYNRTAHLAERKKMMQAWADYLDKLKAGAEVIPFPKVAS